MNSSKGSVFVEENLLLLEPRMFYNLHTCVLLVSLSVDGCEYEY